MHWWMLVEACQRVNERRPHHRGYDSNTLHKNPRCGGGPVKSPGCSTPTFFPRLMMIWERIEISAEVSCRSRVYVGGLGRQLLRAFNASKRSSKCKIGQYTLGPSNRCVRPAARSRPSLRAMAFVTSMVKREQIAVRAASSCTRSDIHACVHCSLYSMYFGAKTDLNPLRGVPDLRVRHSRLYLGSYRFMVRRN